MKILFLAYGMLPIAGVPNRGPDCRTQQIADLLRSLGHEVIVSCDDRLSKVSQHGVTMPEEVAHWCHSYRDLDSIIREADPELIYCAPFVLSRIPGASRIDPGIPLILEGGGPLLLEQAHTHFHSDDYHIVLNKHFTSEVAAIRQADHLVVYGERQKYYYLPFTVLAGWDPAQIERLSVVHSALPDEKIVQERTYPEEPRFVFFGGIYSWTSPLPYINALIDELETAGRGSFHMVGGWTCPRSELPPDMRQLDRRLASSSRCDWQPQLHREKLQEFLAGEMGISFEMFGRNIERVLAIPYRTSEALACGLGILCGDGFELARRVEDGLAGWVVNGDDLNVFRSTIHNILRDEDWSSHCRGATALARDEFSYSAVCPVLDEAIRRSGSMNKSRLPILSEHDGRLTSTERRIIDWLRSPRFSALRRLGGRIIDCFAQTSGFHQGKHKGKHKGNSG